MSYWSKQVIAREVELEKMRRAKPKVSAIVNEVVKKPGVVTKSEVTEALPNHLQRLVPKAITSSKPTTVVSFPVNNSAHLLIVLLRRFQKISSVECHQSHPFHHHKMRVS